MGFLAGKAFENQSVWKDSLKFIQEKGGYIQKFIRKAVENKGFDIFDSYVKFEKSVLFYNRNSYRIMEGFRTTDNDQVLTKSIQVF